MAQNEVSFDASREDKHLVSQIVTRALALYKAHGIKRSALDIRMDLIATHCQRLSDGLRQVARG